MYHTISKWASIAIIALAVLSIPNITWPASIALPVSFTSQDPLTLRVAETLPNRDYLSYSAKFCGSTNVAPLNTISSKEMSPHSMKDEQAFAALDYGSWLRYTKNDWVLAAGSGVRDQYNGNKDAGQLWIDLHTKSPIQNEYYPYITNARLEMQWLGIGRKFRKTVKKTSAEVEIFARYIRANEFITRSAYGSVKGEDFEGLVKIVSSEDPGYEPTPGKGWSLDAHVQATINKDWWCGISVQGLAGKLSWQNLAVEDGYVMSQRVFEDPDGFLHDTGNISGLDYRQDVSLDLLSSGRADVVYSRRIPNVLLGITWVESYSTVPSIGLAWPQKKHWIPFMRWHARDNELQLGCIGSSFQLDVSMNEWPVRSSTNAGLMLQIGPLTF